MDRQQSAHDDQIAELRAQDAARMRELVERKQARNDRRAAEPPLTDDPSIPSGEDPLADEATGSRGSTGGIRNMGGGRS